MRAGHRVKGQPRLDDTRIWERDTTPQTVLKPARGEPHPRPNGTRIWERDTMPQTALKPALLRQAQRIWKHPPVAVVAMAVGLITLLVHGYHVSMAPDVFSDEGIYLLVGANLAKGNGLTLNNGAFLWHPPAYMLIEAACIKLVGLTNADPLTTLLSMRYLNVFFSACTAALLLLFGRKLHSYKAGFIMVALFLMDPYAQRQDS